MLASQQQRGQQGQQQSKNKQKQQQKQQQKQTSNYVPPNFYGQRKDVPAGTSIIKFPDTFQIPIGVPIDPIFMYIKTDSYEDIEKILRQGYDLNKKLFNGVYLYNTIALYYGNIQANKNLKQKIIDRFNRGINPVSIATAKAIEKIDIKDFITDVQTCIDETLEQENGEIFDNDPDTKSNAIIEMDIRLFTNCLITSKLIKRIRSPQQQQQQQGRPPRRRQRGPGRLDQYGGRKPTPEEQANISRLTDQYFSMETGPEKEKIRKQMMDERKRINNEPEPGSLPKREPKKQTQQTNEVKNENKEPTNDDIVKFLESFDLTDDLIQNLFEIDSTTINEKIKEIEKEDTVVSEQTKGGATYNPNNKYRVYLRITTPQANVPSYFYKINPTDFNYLTPLQVAAGYGNASTVAQLVRYGADFRILTKPLNISLRNFADRRPDEKRKNEVITLLDEITNAYDTANADSNLREMRKSYVDEAPENKRARLLPYKETLNYVYSKTYGSLKKGKPVISEDEKRYRDIGKKDGMSDDPKKNVTYSESDNKITRESYEFGYKLGLAAKAGKQDGTLGVDEPRDQYYSDPNTPEEIRETYLEEYNKAKGATILKGFTDGITGKEKNPPGNAFLNFDPDLSNKLKFDTINPKVKDDYESGYVLGHEKYIDEIRKIVGNVKQDGFLDGKQGNPTYTTKYTIETKPLLGATKVPGSAPAIYTNQTYGDKTQKFEIDYGDLDVEGIAPQARTGVAIPADYNLTPDPAGNLKYGAYIKILYDKGYQEGKREKVGGKTYRRKNKGKNRTYKKKLGRK